MITINKEKRPTNNIGSIINIFEHNYNTSIMCQVLSDTLLHNVNTRLDPKNIMDNIPKEYSSKNSTSFMWWVKYFNSFGFDTKQINLMDIIEILAHQQISALSKNKQLVYNDIPEEIIKVAISNTINIIAENIEIVDRI